jgi:hypothetical protein
MLIQTQVSENILKKKIMKIFDERRAVAFASVLLLFMYSIFLL